MVFNLHNWKKEPTTRFFTYMNYWKISRLFGPPCLLGVKVGLYTLCIFACAKLNIIKKMCEMFQWKKDLRIPTTDINQECLLFSVKRYGSHYCTEKRSWEKMGCWRPLGKYFWKAVFEVTEVKSRLYYRLKLFACHKFVADCKIKIPSELKGYRKRGM